MLKSRLLVLSVLLPVIYSWALQGPYCTHLFMKEYSLFKVKPPTGDEINTSSRVMYTNGTKNKTVFSICHTVTVPENCKSDVHTAKLIMMDEEGGCKVIKNDGDYKFTSQEGKGEVASSVTIEYTSKDGFKLINKFVCEPKLSKPDFQSKFDPQTNSIEIITQSMHGCGIPLNFYRDVDKHNYVVAICLAIAGAFFCFFGQKFYRRMFIIAIILIIYACSVFAYLAFIETEQASHKKYLLIAIWGLIICFLFLVVNRSKLVAFTVLSLIVSYEITVVFFTFFRFKIKMESMSDDYIYITGVFLALFLLAYVFLYNFVLILATAIFGSFMLTISLTYFKILQFDLVYNFELRNYLEANILEPGYMIIMLTFIGLSITGIVVQAGLFGGKSGSNTEFKDAGQVQATKI